MLRYVILRHEMPAESRRGSHWDLMLERGKSLRTWALDTLPEPAKPATAVALADHRLAYLSFEGAISGERGSVTHWDQGSYAPLAESADSIDIMIYGTQLSGMLSLRRQRGGAGSGQVAVGSEGVSNDWLVTYRSNQT